MDMHRGDAVLKGKKLSALPLGFGEGVPLPHRTSRRAGEFPLDGPFAIYRVTTRHLPLNLQRCVYIYLNANLSCPNAFKHPVQCAKSSSQQRISVDVL
jgi:hypothetical protein